MKAQFFRVAGDPVPQARPRISCVGAWTPERTKGWRDLIAWRAKEAKLEKWDGRITLYCDFGLRTKRRVDLDNLVKAVMDALTGIAWDDDSQVTCLYASKHHRPGSPGVDVTIEAE